MTAIEEVERFWENAPRNNLWSNRDSALKEVDAEIEKKPKNTVGNEKSGTKVLLLRPVGRYNRMSSAVGTNASRKSVTVRAAVGGGVL